MSHSVLSLVFGILGNISSVLCFLAPVPTFYRVYKKKSTEGFQSIPYVAGLFSAMLWIFYAHQKTGEKLLITINVFGCVVEIIYLGIFVTYCPKKVKISTLRMIMLMNFGLYCSIVLVILKLVKGDARLKVLGWICVAFATAVFAAPLSIIRVVLRTKSVEFLPYQLSILLLISAVMWLMYGISLRDIYVALPNVVGLGFGTVQIILYLMYRNNKPVHDEVEIIEFDENKKKLEAIIIIGPIGEKMEERIDDIQHVHDENKQDKTDFNNNNDKDNINMNKTEEKQSGCEV